MPTYTSKCLECGNYDEYIRVVNDRDSAPVCRKCNSVTKRIISYSGTVWAPTSGGFR